MASRHVDFLTEADQKKWLQQRGWQPDGPVWRDPDSGLTYMFTMALDRAKKAAKLPYDLELHS